MSGGGCLVTVAASGCEGPIGLGHMPEVFVLKKERAVEGRRGAMIRVERRVCGVAVREKEKKGGRVDNSLRG